MIDEMSIYSRALGVTEIQAIYNSGRSGKCTTPMPPLILTQPANQTVTVGASASFTASAGGTPPLSYQWQFNGTNIGGADGSVLLLTNAQLAQAGSYSVVVTNALGSAISSNAVLTVTVAPPCAAPPLGLVSWWPGEGNAADSMGSNSGTLVGSVGFASGLVGQAFSFDGSSYVSIPSSTNLSFSGYTPMSVDLWVYRTGAGTTMHILGKRGGCSYGDLQYPSGVESGHRVDVYRRYQWALGQYLPGSCDEHLATSCGDV